MNYYPHHIGDFNNATRHLTRIERSIYRDLIELYYDSEKPLIDDLEYLCKKILADDEIQIYAVQQVLREYFILTEKGYEHNRCNEIIKEYQRNNKNKSKAGKASAKARKALKDKDKSSSTGVQQVFNSESTGVRNQNQEPEPITKTKQIQKKGVKRFTPPIFSELCDYINSKNYNVSANRFMDYYESNGWKVGKNKMVSWKHAVSSWNTKNNEGNQNGNEENRKLSAAERASKQVRDFDEHTRKKHENNSEGMAADGDMLRPPLD